jgi:4-diphosphocytidyl-2-C-methyl-D-erythritol kinase
MNNVTVLAPAKINLHLKILGKRADGFHALDTRLARISVYDEITLKPVAEGGSYLTCSEPELPCDETNLAMRALRAYQRVTQTGALGWHIHLEKRIPSGAGLGGGSSDAAAVLRALNATMGDALSLCQLAEIAQDLGSDVPFFLYDAVCDATGRGECIEPVQDWSHQLHLVLVKPPFSVPTPWAYQRWAASQPLPGVSYEAQQCEWGAMVNDLERPVFEKHLFLPELKMWLLNQPEVTAALMSGSGSTLFAVVPDASTAGQLAHRVIAHVGHTSWVQVAHTL